MRLPRFAAVTSALTYALLVAGVYTKEAGADLTCGMRWPLCDGAVFGLFPANVPSAIEWFHRLLALVVGVLIVVLLVRAVREYGRDSRITKAVALALVLLPVQAALGALTVLKARIFTTVAARSAAEIYISVGHYGTGFLLFSGLLAATLWAREAAARPTATRGVEADD